MPTIFKAELKILHIFMHKTASFWSCKEFACSKFIALFMALLLHYIIPFMSYWTNKFLLQQNLSLIGLGWSVFGSLGSVIQKQDLSFYDSPERRIHIYLLTRKGLSVRLSVYYFCIISVNTLHPYLMLYFSNCKILACHLFIGSQFCCILIVDGFQAENGKFNSSILFLQHCPTFVKTISKTSIIHINSNYMKKYDVFPHREKQIF